MTSLETNDHCDQNDTRLYGRFLEVLSLNIIIDLPSLFMIEFPLPRDNS